ncbi:MAG: cytochrome C oxidase subunit II [Flavobacterium sp. MedPE-SWcel]|uniref:cytochrome c oxidase subunit II n=1 Tax=uncultured Flavobacterium sp. TaxID=165435 RepID=UPI00091884AA|nr:cytochrome c oxidase subunit II [uncultured Flavobacterium sp.]OIQ21760.1 MAG: cytochrome C oxidase subunit II [Flavobacterium sp. MedPE-SWcel]
MTSLLIIAVLVLLGIAIWQLTKIFHLTQLGAATGDENTEVANDKDNNVNGYLMFAFVGFIYIFTIYSLIKWGHLVLGTPASEHGAQYDTLMSISMWLIFTVQTITQFLLHFFSFKYRGSKDRKAYYLADNDKLEFIWTIIPVIVLTVLILYGLYAWNDIMFVDDEKEEALYVEVYAKQFGWEVRYPGEDGELGKANVRYIKGVNTMGVDMSDPNAQDDITATELHLPKGRKVVFQFRSQDVLHSAYFPHFRAQMNVVPGMVTQFAFTPILTTEEMRDDTDIVTKVSNINSIRSKKSAELIAKGESALDPYEFDYLLLCNKICGASHYNMQMKVVVDEEADFNTWLEDKKTLGATVKGTEEEAKEEVEVLEVLPPAPMDTIVETEEMIIIDSTKVEEVVAKH